MLAILAVLSGFAVADKPPSAEGAQIPAGASSLFTADEGPADTAREPERKPVELGLRFTASTDGHILGLEIFRADGDAAPHRGKLWDEAGNIIARLTFPGREGAGWQYESFATPVEISGNRDYIASYHTRSGYAAEAGYFDDKPMTRGYLSTSPSPDDNGSLYAYGWRSRLPTSTYLSTNYWVDPVYMPASESPGAQPRPAPPSPTPEPTQPPNPEPSSSPLPSPTPPSSSSPTPAPAPPPSVNPPSPNPGGFPAASNTGVPAGVSLASYTGPMTITQPGTVIDAKLIRGTLVIQASNVTITRSKIIGNIDSDSGGVSVTIVDSEVDGGTSQAPAIGYDYITMVRVNVHGSRVSVLCGSNCQITDSWLHDQYIAPGSDWHVNGYVSNGGSNVVLRHNTLACDVTETSIGGGCTGPAASFGDFAPLSDIVYDNNLFVATPGGYCLSAGHNPTKPYGNNPTGIVITNNIFQHGPSGECGFYGAVTSFLASGPGNVFTNNTYDDGTPVRL